jgi:molybdopterin synthase catalytic subunit
MNLEINIYPGPLPPPTPWRWADAGALLTFEGIVRPLEQERPLGALEYQVYEPMTTRHLQKLAREMIDKHQLLALRVEHSRGLVPAGQCSFRLQVASAHRGEGIAAVDQFILRMKNEVPIWKVPVWL